MCRGEEKKCDKLIPLLLAWSKARWRYNEQPVKKLNSNHSFHSIEKHEKVRKGRLWHQKIDPISATANDTFFFFSGETNVNSNRKKIVHNYGTCQQLICSLVRLFHRVIDGALSLLFISTDRYFNYSKTSNVLNSCWAHGIQTFHVVNNGF